MAGMYCTSLPTSLPMSVKGPLDRMASGFESRLFILVLQPMSGWGTAKGAINYRTNTIDA